MSLKGWRLFGLSATIIIYIGGILILSINNIPGTHPKRMHIDRFGEFSSYRNARFTAFSKKMTIRWCTEMRFLVNTELPSRTTTNLTYAATAITNTAQKSSKLARFRRTQKQSQNHQQSLQHSPALSSKISRRKPLIKLQNGSSASTLVRTQEPASLSSSSYLTTSPTTTTLVEPTAQQYPIEGLTALASFPGSGNTWLRYLLQQATGILTGSIYKDYGLMKTGFPAENVCNTSVLVVKTHEWGQKAAAPFSKAILLVRDPEKAILAEFNRRSGGHVGFASPDNYKRKKGKHWQQFVANKLKGWEMMNLFWARNFTGNLKVVFYDDLINDLENVLRGVLRFLEYPVEEHLLSCALMRREGIFRRKKRILPFDPYTPAMRAHLRDRREMVYEQLGRYD